MHFQCSFTPKICLQLRFHSRPHWGAYSRPQAPNWQKWDLLSLPQEVHRSLLLAFGLDVWLFGNGRVVDLAAERLTDDRLWFHFLLGGY